MARLTEKGFYRLCVALPLVVPLLLAPLAIVASYGGGGAVGSALAIAVGVLGWSVLAAGIPYVVLAAILLWRLRAEPAEVYHRFSLRAPLVFTAFLWVWFAVSLPCSDLTLGGRVALSAAFAAPAVPVGYAYVALAHLLLALLRRRGAVE